MAFGEDHILIEILCAIRWLTSAKISPVLNTAIAYTIDSKSIWWMNKTNWAFEWSYFYPTNSIQYFILVRCVLQPSVFGIQISFQNNKSQPILAVLNKHFKYFCHIWKHTAVPLILNKFTCCHYYVKTTRSWLPFDETKETKINSWVATTVCQLLLTKPPKNHKSLHDFFFSFSLFIIWKIGIQTDSILWMNHSI